MELKLKGWEVLQKKVDYAHAYSSVTVKHVVNQGFRRLYPQVLIQKSKALSILLVLQVFFAGSDLFKSNNQDQNDHH